MSNYVFNLRREEKDIGKRIKQSKRHFKWEFILHDNYHKIEAFHSKLSGKKRILIDGKILVKKTELTSTFFYSFNLDSSFCQISQDKNDKFELIIDNIPFSKLLIDQSRLLFRNPSLHNQNESIHHFWKEETPIETSNKLTIQTNFFNENDFDFSNSSTAPKQDTLSKNKLLFPIVPNTTKASSKPINLIEFDDVFPLNGKDSNSTLLQPNRCISNSEVNSQQIKGFNFYDKFDNTVVTKQINSKPSVNHYSKETESKINSQTELNSEPMLINNKQSKNNEFKQKLINSNLVNIDNVLDNNCTKDNKNSMAGTPLNRIQSNSSNNFDFNNKF